MSSSSFFIQHTKMAIKKKKTKKTLNRKRYGQKKPPLSHHVFQQRKKNSIKLVPYKTKLVFYREKHPFKEEEKMKQ